MVCPTADDVMKCIPITEAVEPVPIFPADIVRFLILFPVIVEIGVSVGLSTPIPITLDDVLVALLEIGPVGLPTVLFDTIAVTLGEL